MLNLAVKIFCTGSVPDKYLLHFSLISNTGFYGPRVIAITLFIVLPRSKQL